MASGQPLKIVQRLMPHPVIDEWIAKISKKKFFHGGFSRTPRSARSNDLETQNDENSIMKGDKN